MAEYDTEHDKQLRYEKKFKKRGKITQYKEYYTKKYANNSLSYAGGRHSSHPRLYCDTKLETNDAEHKLVVDTVARKQKSVFSTKHTLLGAVRFDDPYNAKKPNKHTVFESKMSEEKHKKPRRADAPCYINLLGIRRGMYLGNLSCVNNKTIEKLGIDIVINFSKVESIPKHNYYGRSKIPSDTSYDQYYGYNMPFDDTRKMSSKKFKNILTKFVTLVNDFKDKNILICCDKGVNRSVAMAIGYSILMNKLNYTKALEYIEGQKAMVDDTWASLNNLCFAHILQYTLTP
jgi:hypothetical protein